MVHPIYNVCNGSESVSYLGPKTWELIPLEIRAIESLARFKEKIKNGKLMIACVDFAKFSLPMSVFFKTNL